MDMGKTFDIERPLYPKYSGGGVAIGVAANDHLLDFTYLRDLVPEVDERHPDLQRLLGDPRVDRVARRLREAGQVVIGRCSGYEFTVL
jgi:hypothetical protein